VHVLVHGSSLIIVMKKGSSYKEKKMDEYKEELPTSALLL